MSPTPFRTRLLGLAACGFLAAGMSACENDNIPKNADLIAGKKAFVEKCGSCHILSRAGTKGIQGPNLDESFRQALSDGFGRDTLHGVVRGQIKHPADVPQDSPAYMPADLVTGKLVDDVSAYVAAVAARPGEDTGKLASAVPAAGGGEAVEAKDGVLAIPADPGGQLAYVAKQATAPPGPLTIQSTNESSVPHDIAIEGNGVDAKGDVVQDGGVSKFQITLKAGEYTFYCTVAGHREAGMEGTLEVK